MRGALNSSQAQSSNVIEDSDEDDDDDSEDYVPKGKGNIDDDYSDEDDDEDEDEDYEDDDDDSGDYEAGKNSSSEGLDKAQLDLLGVVASLAEYELVTPAMKVSLVRLISKKDDRIMAAYKVFQEYKDTDDLVDTLLRLAKIESTEKTTSHTYDQASSTAFEKNSLPANKALLSSADQEGIVDILSR
jgi:hypothetical protein